MQKIFFVDHHDSFSQNLIAWLESQANIKIGHFLSFDDPNLLHRWQQDPLPLVLSPGPGNPNDMKPSLELIDYAQDKVPIFGVCLGHQMLGLTLGFRVIRSRHVFHGIARSIHCTKHLYASKITEHLQLFDQNTFVGSYNSLTLATSSSDQVKYIKAVDEYEEVQILESIDKNSSLMGWQFHPESFLTSRSQELATALNTWFQA